MSKRSKLLLSIGMVLSGYAIAYLCFSLPYGYTLLATILFCLAPILVIWGIVNLIRVAIHK
jgi:hypothetical protein